MGSQCGDQGKGLTNEKFGMYNIAISKWTMLLSFDGT